MLNIYIDKSEEKYFEPFKAAWPDDIVIMTSNGFDLSTEVIANINLYLTGLQVLTGIIGTILTVRSGQSSNSFQAETSQKMDKIQESIDKLASSSSEPSVGPTPIKQQAAETEPGSASSAKEEQSVSSVPEACENGEPEGQTALVERELMPFEITFSSGGVIEPIYSSTSCPIKSEEELAAVISEIKTKLRELCKYE